MATETSSIARGAPFLLRKNILWQQKQQQSHEKHLLSCEKIFYCESDTIYSVLMNKDYTIQTTEVAKNLPVVGKKLPDIKW